MSDWTIAIAVWTVVLIEWIAVWAIGYRSWRRRRNRYREWRQSPHAIPRRDLRAEYRVRR